MDFEPCFKVYNINLDSVYLKSIKVGEMTTGGVSLLIG